MSTHNFKPVDYVFFLFSFLTVLLFIVTMVLLGVAVFDTAPVLATQNDPNGYNTYSDYLLLAGVTGICTFGSGLVSALSFPQES